MATRTATANGDSINVLIQAADDIIDAYGYTLTQTAAAVCHSLIDSTESGTSEIALTNDLTTTNGISNVKITCSAHKLAVADTPATATTLAFTVASDVASSYPAGMQFTAAGTVANDGDYVVDSPGATFAAGVTTIPCTVAKRPSAQATETGMLQRWTPISIVGDIVNTACDGMVVDAGAMLEILDDVTGGDLFIYYLGIDLTGGTITTLSGTVTGGDYGIDIGGNGTITTLSGTVSGYTGMVMGGTITTLSGTITATNEFGSGLNMNMGGTITTLSGTVTGGYYGIDMGGGTITTLSGEVTGEYGIYMSGGTITTLSGDVTGDWSDIYMPNPGTITNWHRTLAQIAAGLYRTVSGDVINIQNILITDLPTVAFAGEAAAAVEGGRAYRCPAAADVVAPALTSTALADSVEGEVDVTSDNPAIAIGGGIQ